MTIRDLTQTTDETLPHHRTRVVSKDSNDEKNQNSIKLVPVSSRKHTNGHVFVNITSHGDTKGNSQTTGLINQFSTKRRFQQNS